MVAVAAISFGRVMAMRIPAESKAESTSVTLEPARVSNEL